MTNNPPVEVLKSIFKKYDTDSSNSISTKEVKNLCYDLGYYFSDEEAKNVLLLVDKDGTGTVDFNEFAAFWKSNDKFKKIESGQSDRVKQGISYFRYFDGDNSGSISTQEYHQLHKNLIDNNLMHPSVTVEHGLQVLDSNGDGRVSFNEFMQYLDSVQN